MIRGTLARPAPTQGRERACPRCGVIREVHHGRAPLCVDCRNALSPTERAMWA